MLHAFHVVKLATQVALLDGRGAPVGAAGHHRPPVDKQGRRDDPLYRIRNILRAGEESLTDRQRARLETAFTARRSTELVWRCA